MNPDETATERPVGNGSADATRAAGDRAAWPELGDEGADPSPWGSKAAALHALKRAGFPVPPGFVIEPDRQLDDEDSAALTASVEAIGGFPVAVRSSGALEDLDGASFAGQYETFLGVHSAHELARCIEACRRSAHSERVQTYAASRGLSAAGASMPVLVQKLVPAEMAGVAFTLHPLSGREEHALVEVVGGLGERLVSGQATPTSITLSLTSGDIAYEARGSDGVTLTKARANELRLALLEIQAHFGHPQDVEFAVDPGGRLFILQSRPITSIQWRRDAQEQTSADFREGGVSARVCTPLMYALYRDAMQASMQRFLEDVRLVERGREEAWIACYYGRPYWNASAVKRAMGRLPGFDEERFDRDLGVQKQYGEAGPRRVRTTPRTVLAALPAGVAIRREQAAHLERVAAFSEPLLAACRRFRRRISAFAETADASFFRDLRELFELQRDTEKAYFRTIYNNSVAQTELSSLISRMDAATGRDTSVPRLFGGLAGVHHMAMQEGLLKLVAVARVGGTAGAAWREALDEFLAAHGFHGDAELDLAVPRWESAPHRVREIVEAMIASGAEPADPREALTRQRAHYEDELAAVRAALSRTLGAKLRFARAFERRLVRARAFLSAREEMREYSTRCYALVRLYVLEAGRRLAARGALPAAEDVFMMEPEEIASLGEGAAGYDRLEQTISLRRLYYRGYANFEAPGEFGEGVVAGDGRDEPANGGATRGVTGVGCSAGVATGPVRVIERVEDIAALSPGDVLVTRFTDPGWTPAFGIVAAVVTEVGGLLSHAAVIGREYGIPAVLNVAGATKALETGQRVRVDGARGRVEILDAEHDLGEESIDGTT